ncbi:3'(2'),5'-bisphosphate nucleotidase [Buchnera aphidicola (Melanaphis sacchari)]|uniref:3'(2'),5'-bisphosphate nucleotidase CysQ n=1 Tax=Buchnera aphidicola (Melanaphis sacchari) TaxID=2173854 RepID=A0A2U8DFK4_9GAMM|nr:3'(2'),5'-bisphosphate nucleotidase CysQ [Buchnera aphidicola]AWH90265.1 3'(2'),5'-bisphosphate nucleotidase [Buchnera aphidicola (Melanaphis sacchari)]
MLKKVCKLARVAGSAIMDIYSSQENFIKISYKLNNTPITNADYISNNIITTGLTSFFPNIPILSEEQKHHLKNYKSWNIYWLIDPLDGTKEFLKKNGEFTVNISLIQKGIPILGVLYAPFFDILYFSFNKKAWKETSKGCERIYVAQSDVPLLITSRSHIDDQLEYYLSTLKNYKIKKLGSSLKFGYIAEGTAQIYPRFGSTYIWDTAAGHAIVIASGGKMQALNGRKLDYLLSSQSSLINPGFFATS